MLDFWFKRPKQISINKTFQNTSTETRAVEEIITIESDSTESTMDETNEKENETAFSDSYNGFSMF